MSLEQCLAQSKCCMSVQTDSLIKDRWFFPPCHNHQTSTSGPQYNSIPSPTSVEDTAPPSACRIPIIAQMPLSLCSCYSFCLECPCPCLPLPVKPARQFQCHRFWDAFLMAQAVATSLLRAHSHTSMTACHTLSPPRWKTPKGSVICHLSTYQHAWYIVNAKKCLLNEWMNKEIGEGFPSGSVVKNLPANARDKGDSSSISGLGRSHVLWSN